MNVYCGLDWAEHHHDAALVDDAGKLLAKKRITDDAAGYRLLLELLAEHGATPQNPIPVAIETSHGLLVATLRTGSRQIYAVNPLSAARYRDRHAVSRKKSDHGDALVLANILRTDMAAHRPLPQDTDLARAITVPARAQQDAVWARQQLANQVRSLLRNYYPAALDAFLSKQNGLIRPDTRIILSAAPTPGRAAKLTITQLQAALRRAGRVRGWQPRRRGCRRSSAATMSGTRKPSRTRWASSSPPCCSSWTRHAGPLTGSPSLWRNHSSSTRTRRSS